MIEHIGRYWRMRLFPFCAFALNFTTLFFLQFPIFSPRLLQLRLTSFGAFSYRAYCHYWNAKISYVNGPIFFPSQGPEYQFDPGLTSPAPSSVGAGKHPNSSPHHRQHCSFHPHSLSVNLSVHDMGAWNLLPMTPILLLPPPPPTQFVSLPICERHVKD